MPMRIIYYLRNEQSISGTVIKEGEVAIEAGKMPRIKWANIINISESPTCHMGMY
jgi:hypothetical protein